MLNLLYAVLGISKVYAETPSVLENVVSEAGSTATGVVGIMGTFSNFLTTNALMLIILGIAFCGLAGRYLFRFIISLRLG